MILSLRTYETFPARWEAEFSKSAVQPHFDGLLEVKNGHVSLEIQKSDSEYYCQGKLETVVSLECSRCLEPFDLKLAGDIDFIACSRDHYASIKSEAIDDEDYVFIESADLSANITVPIEQAIILAIDMKPLCREDCHGICPSCGTNLNLNRCDCITKETDPRWDALKGLRGA